MFASLVEAASAQLPSFPLRTLSGLMWALAGCRHYDRTFYGAAAGALTALLQRAGAVGAGAGAGAGADLVRGGETPWPLPQRPAAGGGPTVTGVQRRAMTAEGKSSSNRGGGGGGGSRGGGSAYSPLDLTCTSMAFAQFNHYDG